MRIGKKLAFVFASIILMILLAGIFSIFQINKLVEITEDIYLHPLQVSNALRDIKIDIMTIDGLLKDITQAQNIAQIHGKAAIIDNYEQYINSEFKIVYKNFLGELSAVNYLKETFDKWYPFRKTIITLSLQKENSDELNQAKLQSDQQMTLLLYEIDGLINFAKDKAAIYLSKAKEEKINTIVTMLIMIISITIIGILSSIRITKSIVTPLGLIVKSIWELSKGSLKGITKIDTKDEIGKLADSFNSLQKDLLQRTKLLEKIATGDFSTDILPRSEDDDLGKSFYTMTLSLRKKTKELNEAYNIINNSPAVGFLWRNDKDWTVDYVTKNVFRLYGFTAEEFTSGTVRYEKIVYPDDLAALEKEVFSHLNNTNRDDEFIHKPYRIITKDGKIKWIREVTYSRKNLQGEITHNQGILIDITEQQKGEQMLKIALIEAESANKTKSEFLSSMSHELRTPLNAILGFSQVLDSEFDGKLNIQQKDYVGSILESGKHLLSLVNDILDLSKIESGKTDLLLEKLDIEEILNNSLIIIKDSCSKQNISLNLQTDESVKNVKINADSRKFKQIMYNLLSNAVKFTPRGGSITVEASTTSGHLTVSIIDSGIGITKEDQARIFEKFFQTKRGYINKTKGTGLGLNIADNLINLHGGKLKVQSDGINKGTTFIFTIPLNLKKKIGI